MDIIKCAVYIGALNIQEGHRYPYFSYSEDGNGWMRNKSIFFTPGGKGNQADWLFVLDSPHRDFMTTVPRERRILFIAEPPMIRVYDKKYLEQYGFIISPYNLEGYTGVCMVNNPCLAWYAGITVGAVENETSQYVFKNIEDARNFNPLNKTKMISMITSLKHRRPGHKARIKFKDALVEKFGDKIDLYGREFNPIPDKLNAIAPYKYSIVVENTRLENYWSEKLTDAWVGWSLPIYFGDPNITKAIPDPLGIEVIDIENTEEAFKTIENMLTNDPYNDRVEAIRKCRDWVISESNPLEKVCQIIESSGENRHKISPLEIPELMTTANVKLKNKMKRFVRKISGANKNADPECWLGLST